MTSGSREEDRLYYVMGLRDLLPLAVGCHYFRMPTNEGDHDPHGTAGLECWLVQTQHDGKSALGGGPVGEVASKFLNRDAMFERVQRMVDGVNPEGGVFMDHRKFGGWEEEMEALGPVPFFQKGLCTVAIVGGVHREGPEEMSHWARSFRLVAEWVDSLRPYADTPLPAITDVESIYPVYLIVSESASGDRQGGAAGINTADRRVHVPISREGTTSAAHHFRQRRLGNPSAFVVDWVAKAESSCALGDHGKALIYSAIAAELIVKHTAWFMKWEDQRFSPDSLKKLIKRPPMKLIEELGSELGFEPPGNDGCPDEIQAWRTHIAKPRNRMVHLGWYPSGSESDAAVTAMRDFVDYLTDRIVACADCYRISALVLCDPYRISDQTTRKQVLSLSERHDEFVCEYIDALAEEYR